MASLGGDQGLLLGGQGGGDETWLATGFMIRVKLYLPVVVWNH